MKPIPVLGVPVLNRPDLLSRMVASIDYPVKNLVFIDNANRENSEINQVIEEAKKIIPHTFHCSHPNAGVAGSWNEIIMLFPAPWWMIVGSDIQFTPGDLAKMANESWREHERVACLFANHGHSFFCITKRGVRNVGLFDPNIYPAYCEDCLWSWQAKQTGEVCVDVQGVNSVHGELVNGVMHGSRTVNSDPKITPQNCRTHGLNFGYYTCKTGGMPGKEIFKKPFNNPGYPINAIVYDPDIRERNQWH